VTDAASLLALGPAARAALGRLDVWVNNVGQGISRQPSELTDDDIDEMMVGANYLERRGWETKRENFKGLGRHRISSALFYYVPCPAGGHAEYISDADYLDDSWLPRDWDERFGSNVWIHDIPEYLREAPSWDVKYYEEPK